MSDSTLYDDDILIWSEQQAAVIRELGRTRRDLPNALDIENVAEEIETVGRSELAAVKSYIRLIFLHLMMLAAGEGAEAERHWRSEIIAFHSDLVERYASSMRQRIDLEAIWRSAREQSLMAYVGPQEDAVAALPVSCPLALDDLLASHIDSFALAEKVRRAGDKS